MKIPFLFLFLALSGEAHEFDLRLPFICPQTIESQVPASAEVVLKFNEETQDFSSPLFESWMETALLNHDQYDFFSCFINFLNQAEETMRSQCQANSAPPSTIGSVLFALNPELGKSKSLDCMSAHEALEKLRGLVLNYGENINLNKPTLTPFSPGDNARPPLSPEQLTEMKNHLAQACQGNAEALTGPYFLDRHFLTHILPGELRKLQASDPLSAGRCQQGILKAYVPLLEFSQMPESFCAKASELCASRRAALTRTTMLLKQAGLTLPEIGDSEAEALCGWNTQSFDPEVANLILQERKWATAALSKLLKQENCEILRPGTSKEVVQNQLPLPTGFYQLKRLEDRPKKAGDSTLVPSFQIKVPIHFEGAEQSKRQMIEKTRACLNEVRPSLRGPNGEFLSIELDLKGPGEERTHTVVIGSTPRAHSNLWDPDIQCDTVIHEILHLLGLVDEYHEHGGRIGADGKWNEEGPRYECRALGPPDSIMRNSKLAYKKAVKDNPPSRSLLYPAQFRFLMTAGCEESNKYYHLCASQAYASTMENGERKRCETVVPALCFEKDGKWLK